MERTDALFRGVNEGPEHGVLGMRHVYKASSRDTGGAYVSFEIEIPSGCGAPPHVHAVDSESFYVLAGRLGQKTPEGDHQVEVGGTMTGAA